MTRIDFYQIDPAEPPLMFCCRLVDLAYRKGHEVYVHTGSATDAEALDELLWNFRPDRFLPHGLLPDQSPARIHIGHGTDPGAHKDVLVNLSGEIPAFFSRFARVTEIVPHAQKDREKARTNYRFYKDRGYPIDYHDLKK